MDELNEYKNLHHILWEYLGRMVDHCKCKEMNPMEFRYRMGAFYDFPPDQNWLGRSVFLRKDPNMQGVIKAVKEVEGIYIPGVEFKEPVHGGHHLSLATISIKLESKAPQSCLWVPLEDIKFILD